MTRDNGCDVMAPQLFQADVLGNQPICREHYRLTLSGIDLSGAAAGQFLHIAPSISDAELVSGTSRAPSPLLRRAFSIADLCSRCEVDLIYRVVGTATTWMSGLRVGESVSVIGPLGNAFPIDSAKEHAWVVGGGVGLPPMLWLAQALRAAERNTVALVGARSADLLALSVTDPDALATDGRAAAPAAAEFAKYDVPVVVSTDDGSLGFRGHVGQVLATYYEHSGIDPAELVIYACGPEVMMSAVATFCAERSIDCYVCMERSMACGTGTCQSCVVAVNDDAALDGWRYELCCAQGPVFDATRVIWSDGIGGGLQH